MTLKAEKTDRQFRVIKIGGSLFSLPDLKERVETWSQSISDPKSINVWIPGGGRLVDEVRNWDSRHGLDPQTAHSISIDLLASTAHLFHSLFDEWILERDFEALLQCDSERVSNIIFDCSSWAKVNANLERSWDTTSDTIALELAGVLRAKHLFLLKSVSPSRKEIDHCVRSGIVDANFSSAWTENPEIPISITNLRVELDAIELVQ